jgi:ubiquinone/menaquinone biosynthesis C-methylase UbiE
MDVANSHINEVRAAVAFSRQSAAFDELYSRNAIIRYKRRRVRSHVLALLEPASNILELNAGTGEDAIFFAQHGHRVLATDISDGMMRELTRKVQEASLSAAVTNETISYTHLSMLSNKGPFDCIFSNFAGLNCTDKMDQVLREFSTLLKPGGIATLVILPKFCLWETLLLFKGKFNTASRRFFARKGRRAQVEGVDFRCWYYSPRYIAKQLRDEFDVIAVEGLCTLVPPSYIENFADKYPRLFSYLCKWEDRLKRKWPWKHIGDYYIISLRRR